MSIGFNKYNTLNKLEYQVGTSLKLAPISNSSSYTTLNGFATGSSRSFYLPSNNANNAPAASINGLQVSDEANSWVMITQSKIFNYSSITTFLTALNPEINYSSTDGFHFKTGTARWAEVVSGQYQIQYNVLGVTLYIQFKSPSTTLKAIVLTPTTTTTSTLPDVDFRVTSMTKNSSNVYVVNVTSTGFSSSTNGEVYINYLAYGGH